MTATAAPAASATALVRHYGTGPARVTALRGVDLELAAGRFTAIMGPSGSGKSTLLHCLAGLDRADGGEVRIGATALSGMSDKELTRLRRDRIGFVFQAFNLVPTLTARENITLPADIAGRRLEPARVDAVVDALGLSDRLTHLPAEMSGGQQQRVACARALVGRPDILFADEPTGNLDTRSSAEVLAILRAAVDDSAQTVVMVTHDPQAAAVANRVVFLRDGLIDGELTAPTTARILERLSGLEHR